MGLPRPIEGGECRGRAKLNGDADASCGRACSSRGRLQFPGTKDAHCRVRRGDLQRAKQEAPGLAVEVAVRLEVAQREKGRSKGIAGLAGIDVGLGQG